MISTWLTQLRHFGNVVAKSAIGNVASRFYETFQVLKTWKVFLNYHGALARGSLKE